MDAERKTDALQPTQPYPEYGPKYPQYYGTTKKANLWNNSFILMWLATTSALLAVSVVGLISINADKITIEEGLAIMFGIGIVSAIVLGLYWLTFHDCQE